MRERERRRDRGEEDTEGERGPEPSEGAAVVCRAAFKCKLSSVVLASQTGPLSFTRSRCIHVFHGRSADCTVSSSFSRCSSLPVWPMKTDN